MRTKVLLIGLALCVGVLMFFSWWVEEHQQANNEDTAVQVEQQTKTEVAYVPKVSKMDSDVELNRLPLKVSINGKQHEIPTSHVKETQRLENGKLVVTEEQVIKVEIPEQPKVKKGVYIEPKDQRLGVRVSYQSKNYDVDLKQDLYSKNKDNKTTLTFTKWL